jgi:hypothetical protein
MFVIGFLTKSVSRQGKARHKARLGLGEVRLG